MGRERGTPTAALTDEYIDRGQRLARGLGIAGPALTIVEAPKGLEGRERQRREAGLLDDALPGGGVHILLDERGKDLSSRDLAKVIADTRDQGAAALSIVIGGADGFLRDHKGPLLTKPARKIAFGKATWPHMLCRTMAAEQLYRALTILAGHPYHRD